MLLEFLFHLQLPDIEIVNWTGPVHMLAMMLTPMQQQEDRCATLLNRELAWLATGMLWRACLTPLLSNLGSMAWMEASIGQWSWLNHWLTWDIREKVMPPGLYQENWYWPLQPWPKFCLSVTLPVHSPMESTPCFPTNSIREPADWSSHLRTPPRTWYLSLNLKL